MHKFPMKQGRSIHPIQPGQHMVTHPAAINSYIFNSIWPQSRQHPADHGLHATSMTWAFKLTDAVNPAPTSSILLNPIALRPFQHATAIMMLTPSKVCQFLSQASRYQYDSCPNYFSDMTSTSSCAHCSFCMKIISSMELKPLANVWTSFNHHRWRRALQRYVVTRASFSAVGDCVFVVEYNVHQSIGKFCLRRHTSNRV